MKPLFLLKALFFIVSITYAHSTLASVPETLEATKDNSKQFIEVMGTEVLSVIKDQSLNEKAKEQKLTEFFKKSFDIPWVSKFVLGKYWRTISQDEKQRFQTLYEDFLVQSYVPRFREYTSEHFKVTNVISTSPLTYLVQTEIYRPNGMVLKVDYHVHKQDDTNSLAVFDIIAEGVSLITTQRSDFSSIMTKEGVNGLLNKLTDKVGKQAKK